MNDIKIIPLGLLAEDPLNARHGAIDETDLGYLAQSMREIGQLQPIVVRPDASADPEARSYLVSIGRRRLLAARRLGWGEMRCVVYDGDDAGAEAASAAENIARTAMHPVDEWRAVSALADKHGWPTDRAANAIGVDPARIPRMRHLARMAPAVLDAIKADGRGFDLRLIKTISYADHATQLSALKSHTGTDGKVEWWHMAGACTIQRVSLRLALFDPEAAGVAFAEDLFAQPDDADRYFTTNVSGFLKAQRIALDKMAAASHGHVEIIELALPHQHAYGAIPKDWVQTYGALPKRWRKTDPRHAFVCLYTHGSRLGETVTMLCEPAPARPGAAAAGETPPVERPVISKPVQRLLAEAKASAVRERLVVLRDNGPAAMLHVLLLTFLCDNVSVTGGAYATAQAVTTALIDADGNPRRDVDTQTLCTLAAAVAGTAVTFKAPDVYATSGPGAEWLALAIGAALPRCDTEELLAGVAGHEIKRLATEAGISTAGTITAIRRRLVGNLPDWQPAPFQPVRSLMLDLAADDAAEDDDTAHREAAE